MDQIQFAHDLWMSVLLAMNRCSDMYLILYWSTRPVVIFVFAHVISSHVRPSPLFKTKLISYENNDRYWRDCGSGRVDHWCHQSVLYWLSWHVSVASLSTLRNVKIQLQKLRNLCSHSSICMWNQDAICKVTGLISWMFVHFWENMVFCQSFAGFLRVAVFLPVFC